MSMENPQAMDNIIGPMEAFSKVTSKMDYAMEMVCGNVDQANPTSTRDSMPMIRNAAMASLRGRVAIRTRATISMMYDMVLARCTGMMGVAIKVTGNVESSMVKVMD